MRRGRWFATSAGCWMNLQSLYDLRVAEQSLGDEIAGLPGRPDGVPVQSQSVYLRFYGHHRHRGSRGASASPR
jgi:hypothetical protein